MKENYDRFECDVELELTEPKDCPGEKICANCAWYKLNNGYCPGCDEDYRKRCLKRICAFTSCGSCSGGSRVDVIGCCGRAPETWRKRWNKLLEYSIHEYSPEPPSIECRLIPIIYHQIKKFRIPEKFKQIDTWAVPIRKVSNLKGDLKSSDLKDYLGLPSDRKLILNTCAFDNYEELLWKMGPEINYKQVGIDYWFPAHFSIYDNDSKIYQFANAKRQQLHAIWTKSQFVWFRLGEHIPKEFLAPIRKASSVLISTNQMTYKHNKEILNREVKIADRWFPPKTDFFVIGSFKKLPISRNRIRYQIDSNWIIKGIKGANLKGVVDKSVPKEKVLINNLQGVLDHVYEEND